MMVHKMALLEELPKILERVMIVEHESEAKVGDCSPVQEEPRPRSTVAAFQVADLCIKDLNAGLQGRQAGGQFSLMSVWA